MRRRTFLHSAGATLGLAMIGCRANDEGATDGRLDTGLPSDTGEASPFQTPLHIPPVLEPTDDNGTKVFALTAQPGTHAFFAGQPAETMGYNGNLLGPTLRVRDGDAVRITVTNELSEPHATHWHGAHVPAAADGGPHQLIAPGESWTAAFTVNQVAATLWYHPHAMGYTASQVYAGLAGLLLVDDDASDALDLPNRYGIDDVPIIVQDRRFTSSGALEYTLAMSDIHMGFQGDTFLVNGTHQPFFEAEATLLRLRVLNGANGRVSTLAFADGSSFDLIGIDGGLRETPLSLTAIRLSPGERAELVLDLTGRLGEVLRLVDQAASAELMEIRVTREPAAARALPASLATLEVLDEAEAVRTRPFVMSMMQGTFFINGTRMDPSVINEVVPVDEVEVWELRNTSMMAHNFHMHAGHFQVVSRNGGAPEPAEMGYKDTVYVGPSETVRVLVRHRDYTDATLPYMYHCHFLEHEDQGMMGQFTVV